MQGWFSGARALAVIRLGVLAAALLMIEGGLLTDAIGIGAAAALFFARKMLLPGSEAVRVRG